MSISAEEKLLPLLKAVEMETGQRPHAATLHRWRLKGVSGVQLETVRVGGRRFTSREAVRRFIERSTAAVDNVEAPLSETTTRSRDAAAVRVDRGLARHGV